MTRFNLETELANAWDAEVAKLTPEERAKLAKVTPQDVTRAVAELITDPTFWQGIGRAFLDGMARGFDKHR